MAHAQLRNSGIETRQQAVGRRGIDLGLGTHERAQEFQLGRPRQGFGLFRHIACSHSYSAAIRVAISGTISS